MSAPGSLAPLLESFFRDRLTRQRNASSSTIGSYRDALRLLVLFAAGRTGRKPCALAIQDFDRDLVLAFLDELEAKRKNTIRTRNARLTAIRSFFHHVAANDPASLGIAQRILAIPIKRSHIEVTHHLSGTEVDAVIEAPDQGTQRGRRDRTLLLFLARTGARVSEAIGVNAGDLQLDRPRSQVLLRGKGRKERIVPIAKDLVKALKALVSEGERHYRDDGEYNQNMHRSLSNESPHGPGILLIHMFRYGRTRLPVQQPQRIARAKKLSAIVEVPILP